MIIHINDFYHLFIPEDENCSIFPVNSEAPDSQVAWFKQFRLKTGMRWVILKKRFLFGKLSLQSSLLEVLNKLGMQR